MEPNTAMTIGVVLAIIGTILAFIFIMPESKKAGLNKFFSVLRDIFSFKDLFLEKVLRVLYIFATLVCVFGGFFMLFARSYGWYSSQSLALYGFMMIIIGPIVVRLFFEASMMFIFLVKNTMSINSKIGGPEADTPAGVEEQAKPRMIYCTKCGTQYDAGKGVCPKCNE